VGFCFFSVQCTTDNNNNNINNGRISIVLLKEGKINGVRTRDRHVLTWKTMEKWIVIWLSMIGPTRVTWYLQIITFDRCSSQKYRSVLAAADFWSPQCECVVLYTKPAASSNIDSELCLLPAAAPCPVRTGYRWCSWARWSVVCHPGALLWITGVGWKGDWFVSVLPSVQATCPNSERCWRLFSVVVFSVCNMITFESLDIDSSFVICWYNLKGYGSGSYMKFQATQQNTAKCLTCAVSNFDRQ